MIFNHNCIEYLPAPAEFEPLAKRALELVKQIDDLLLGGQRRVRYAFLRFLQETV